MNFTINGTSVPQVEKYDNQGAHNAIKSMMQRKETLSIRLYTDKDNYPYIWIESYNVAGFKYYVTPISFKWIYTYLTTGESEDGGIQPTELTPYQTGEDNNFQLSILKQLVESGNVYSLFLCFVKLIITSVLPVLSYVERYSFG